MSWGYIKGGSEMGKNYARQKCLWSRDIISSAIGTENHWEWLVTISEIGEGGSEMGEDCAGQGCL